MSTPTKDTTQRFSSLGLSNLMSGSNMKGNQVTKPIAIVGISVEIPSGADSAKNLNHESFFEFLLNKRQAYEKFPPERFGYELSKGPNLGQVVTDSGSFLKDIFLFDPAEFGITSKDAKAMAVGTRKLIETAFLALLDSGIDYRGRNVGCYMSAVAFDTLSMPDADVYEPRGSFAGYPYMVANKVSYHLDLLGPSVPVDTACSSTMTGLHLAVQALRAGDCESAIVGGCQLNHRFLDFIQYSLGSVLSPDGKCKPFDISADGFSRGEGAGAVVLKPLEDALRDGDFIYASILGTGINSTGSAGPVSAPVAEAQIDAMHRAYAGTGRLPGEVDYIELHATGTAVGDPIEANWAGSKFQRDDELLVGSVKGNIGHLEIMSFIASLSKVCSIFRSGIIPPTVNLDIPNPAIRWDEYRMRAPIEPTPLSPRHPSGKALISMSSSGIGGSNGHAVLESPPVLPVLDGVNLHVQIPILFIAAGLSPRSASDVGDTLADLISRHDPHTLSALSNTYGRRSRQMSWRSAGVYIPSEKGISFPPPRLAPRKKRPIVFVFSGQGPQHFQMGRQLFKIYAPFRESIERMDRLYAEATGTSLIQQTGLFSDNPSAQGLPEIWPISITLPALAMLQMALCDLLAFIGIVPDVVVGHSAGETAVLYASGAASQTAALHLAIARGLAMSLVEGAGSMAAIACDTSVAEDLIEGVLKEYPHGVLEIACHNSRDSVTLAGTTNLIDEAVVLANSRGLFARKLRTNVPVHSSLMESCKRQYQEGLSAIFGGNDGSPPRIRTYSSLTGQAWEEPFSAEYFWSNTRRPVLFSQAISALLRDYPNALFMEVGPHPVLSSYIESFDNSISVVAPMRRSQLVGDFHDMQTLLSAIGSLIMEGCNVSNFAALIPQSVSRPNISIPPYPFAPKYISYRPDITSPSIQATQRKRSLNGPSLGLNSLTHPALAQHVIRNEAIMPAAGYLEMAFQFGASRLWNVQFKNIMPLFSDRVLRVQVLKEGHFWHVRSWKTGTESNNAELGAHPPRLHAHGYMSQTALHSDSSPLDLDSIRDRCPKLDIGGFYERITFFAQFGQAYQRVTGCYVADSEGLIRIRASEADLPDEGTYHFNPVVLDACIHALVHPVFTRNLDKSVYYLPSSVETVTLHQSFEHQKLPSTLYTYAKLNQWDPEFAIWDLCITDDNGSRICTLIGLRVSLHRISPYVRSEKYFKLVYQPKGIQQRSTLSEPGSTPIARVKQHSVSYGNCLDLFRDRVRTIIQLGKQVVRVFILYPGSSEPPVHYQIDVPESVFLDYSFGTNPDEQNPPIFAEDAVRKLRFRLNSPLEDQDLGRSRFDVIIVHDIASYHDDPLTFMKNMNGLLEPGGCLIMGKLGEEAIPHDGRDGSTLRTGSFWKRTALDVNFSCVELHLDTTDHGSSLILEAQKLSWPALPWNSANPDVPLVVDFVLDHILQHQWTIREYGGASLWISATSGTAEGGAALGFARSLRRELHSTQVHLVLFDPIWSPNARLLIIGDLATSPDVEVETLVDMNGNAHVPRIVRCPSTLVKHDFDPGNHWVLDSDSLFVEPPPLVPDHHVLVRVTHLAFSIGGLQGFAGRIEDPGSTAWSREELVVGVVDSAHISSHFLVHEGQIAAAPEEAFRGFYVACAVPLVLLAIGLGTGFIHTPVRLRGRKFLVTNADEPTGRWLTTILSGLGVVPETSICQPTETSLEVIRQSHFIFSGYSSRQDIQVIQSAMNSDASAVWWNGSAIGLEIRRNPWLVGDILSAIEHLGTLPPANLEVTCSSPEERLAQNPCSHIQRPLFHSQRSYLLIGGIGSLGLNIAWWMYQKGARHIILTSRSGETSLRRDNNTYAIRLLAYLRGLPNLDLRLEECDAASDSATAAMVAKASPPLAGCMLLAVVFADRAFLSHTETSFYIPFVSKEGALRALEKALTISSLDFLIALSSVTGLFGSPGQTNYAGANTSVDSLLRVYPNAFSITAPAIVNSNFLTDLKNLSSDSRFKMWTAWGITSRHLCDCIEDGILALNHGSSNTMYLPDVDWEQLRRQLGDSPMYDHFLNGPEGSRKPLSEISKSSLKDSVREIAVKVLDMDAGDFSPEVPFTSYGLDSLSAGRLSYILKPYLGVTQVQLLADMSLADLYEHIELSEQTAPNHEVNLGRFDWEALNQSGQTVVPLVEGDGTPLIVIHGSSGNILALLPLQERFSSPLWAIQTTPETPFGSFDELAVFYFKEIKALRPFGPYRLAGYSGNSLLAFQVALLFEKNGDHVVQLVMLDHFPILFSLSSLFHLDKETITTNIPSRALIWQSLNTLFDLYKRDPSPSRQTIPDQLTDAFQGRQVTEFGRSFYGAFVNLVTVISHWLLNELGKGGEGLGLKTQLERWMMQVKAPVTIIVAKNGFRLSLPSGWDDLGCRGCFPEARVVSVDSGHFSMFELDAVVEELQHGW
ncbi:putative polyketide synthase [Mycena galericulata]|nr:putative polyketide synthase [Mycena galericulata]